MSLGLATDFNGYPLTDGSYDDLRIFNTALTSTQVQSIYMPSLGALVPQYIKSATGGNTVQDINGYRIHTFTTVGTSTFTPATAGNVEVLVVAGGGGSGGNNGGGGSGGQVQYFSSTGISGAVSVTIGAGGTAGSGSSGTGGTGGTSSFGAISCVGGGGGGHGGDGTAGAASAYGGGRGFGSSTTGLVAGTSGSIAYAGGGAYYTTGTTYGVVSSGGGGGAGGSGQDGSSGKGGDGGKGVYYSISSINTGYSGGGAGNGYGGTPGTASEGGGGVGGPYGYNEGTPGTPNTGGGAGGGWYGGNSSGSIGGSGIVIVRYPLPVRMSGTPLFSQLSTSATSSAVGAFSLRAVNGTSPSGTAKAVAVQAHPIVQWPPVAMTSNTTVVTGQTYGNGTYVASDLSGGVVTTVFRMSDNDINTFYEQHYTGSNYYDYNLGTLIDTTKTTTVSGASAAGWWVQLQLPTSIILRSYTLVGRQDNRFWETRNPTTFWIAGSTDGSTWSNVHFQSGISYGQSGTTISVPQTSNSLAYSYYRLIVNVIGNSGASGNHSILDIASWNLYGDSASYAPNAAQDFWADRLGNLLTAPVTGQTLQNWLGGATGYVTTWYDQSGKGNDATQGTAANQPIIQKATKGPGYSCLFNGNQSLALGSNAYVNNTPYTIQVVECRNVDSVTSGAGYFGWGSGETNPTSNIAHIGYRAYSLSYPSSQQTIWTNQYADDASFNNISIKFATAATENVAYTWHTHDLNHTARIYTWRGGVMYPSSFSTTTGTTFINFLRPIAINQYFLGWSPQLGYYQGEIYELLVFTKSLYDLDNTGGLITQIYQNQLSYTGT